MSRWFALTIVACAALYVHAQPPLSSPKPSETRNSQIARERLGQATNLMLMLRKLNISDEKLSAVDIHPEFEVTTSSNQQVRLLTWPQTYVDQAAYATEVIVDRESRSVSIEFVDFAVASDPVCYKVKFFVVDEFIVLPENIQPESAQAIDAPAEDSILMRRLRVLLPNRVQILLDAQAVTVINGYARYQVDLKKDRHGNLYDGNGMPQSNTMPTLIAIEGEAFLRLGPERGFWLNHDHKPSPKAERWWDSGWAVDSAWEESALSLLSELEWHENRLESGILPSDERVKVTQACSETLRKLQFRILPQAARSVQAAAESLKDSLIESREKSHQRAIDLQWSALLESNAISQVVEELSNHAE